MTCKDEIVRYAKDCVSGKIPSGQKHKWACQRFLNDLKRIGQPDFPYVWDEERAEKLSNGLHCFATAKVLWQENPLN